MGIEALTDKELVTLHDKCAKAAETTQRMLDRATHERKKRGHAFG
jgi:hypothetical protein